MKKIKIKNKKNSLSVKKKVIVIFGGSGLLGAEFAKHLLSQSAIICVADLSKQKFNIKFKNELKIYKKKLIFYKTSIQKQKSISACLKYVLKKFKKIDVVINSAAMNAPFNKNYNKKQFTSFYNYPNEMWNKSLKTNLSGAFMLAKETVKYFQKINKGHLINIGSIYGLVAPDQSIYKEKNLKNSYKPADYVVSKFGILGLNKYLAAYFKNTKIRFNVMTPSGVRDNQSENFIKKFSKNTILNRMSEKYEYNGVIQFLCSDASSYMTGSNVIVDGGWTVT